MMLPPEELLKKFGGSSAVLKKSIEAFLRTWPDELAAFQRALDAQDSSAVASKVHRIKGFVGYFATEDTYHRVISLEHAAKANNLDDVRKAKDPLERELGRLAESLATLSTSLG